MMIHVEIMIISMLVAIACVLPGIFLVLRGVALMSDAISHSIVLGIVCMFFIVKSLSSPWLLIGASLAGLLTVIGTEIVIKQRHMKEDAALGLVFPAFFSLGIILMSLYARNVHLDIDMVMLGEIAFAPFNRLYVWGIDWGPQAIWVLCSIIAVQVIALITCYKELVILLFDPEYAHISGISSGFLYYGLMTITSITAVGAFDIVGSIVIVALMITPAATALLVSSKLENVIALSLVCGIVSGIVGYLCAYAADVSISGSIAVVSGVLFLLIFIRRCVFAMA